MSLQRYLLGATVWMLVSTANADEYYEFLSIRCMPQLQAIRLDFVGIWNVGDWIWPSVPEQENRKSWVLDSWQRHENALKTLERKHGLHVFGQQYGRQLDSPIICELPHFRVSIAAARIEREYVDEDIRVAYRGRAEIQITALNGSLVFSETLDEADDFQAAEASYGLAISHCKKASESPSRHVTKECSEQLIKVPNSQ
ncbi:hypothetical protein [Pseudomonas sp. ML96]|uniref:hypothetical protein n=1 Tax=Pseudomonas sp. ML96 TaxID=1523503 RepID=UPI0005B81573|nr:hypothetical protein [Pseudomonas sp. ML96]